MQGLSLLKNVPILAGLSDSDLRELSTHLQPFAFRRDRTIVTKSDEGSGLFIITKGHAKVVLTERNKGEVILAFLKEGDFFGEMSLLDGRPRSASVVAQTDTDLVALHRGDFLAFLQHRPRVALHLLEEMSLRLRDANSRIGSLALLDVYGRVARVLMDLGRKRGEVVDSQIIIKDKPTQSEIAAMAGTTRETVSRAMTELTRQGFIATRGRRLVITDRAALEQVT